VSSAPARTIRVLDTFPFDHEARALLDASSSSLRIEHRPGAHLDADALRGVEVLLCTRTAPMRAQAPELRWLQLGSAGADHLDLDPAWGGELTVSTASGAYAPAVAEYVLAALLHASQDMPARLANQRARGWPETRGLEGRPLRGATLTVVGYGGIGRELARVACALGMRVLAVKENQSERADKRWHLAGTGDPDGSLPERITGPAELRAIAAETDYLALAAPLTSGTRGLVDRAVLRALRPGAWVVNVGRGALLDEAALLAELASGQLGGAVLDVTEQEPLPPDSPLWACERVLITPHVAGRREDWPALARLVADNLARYARGAPVLNIVAPLSVRG
jgi:phosphoglycerate dehydrogenase-like enzyme